MNHSNAWNVRGMGEIAIRGVEVVFRKVKFELHAFTETKMKRKGEDLELIK